jgi:parallel beta-helix repeat protein
VGSRRRIVGLASAGALILGLMIASPAAAAPLACGQTVTTSTTLAADLVCPSGDGLVLQGNDITLNLNGHAVRGELDSHTIASAGAVGDNGVLGAPYTVRFAKGQFVGIRIRGSRNTVTGPGAVRQFAAGILVDGGSANTVTRLTIEENFGPPGTTDLGDGIMVSDSTANNITTNTVRNNGPFDGIVLLGASGHNVIWANTVADNRQPEICPTYDYFRFSTSGGGIVQVCGPTHPSLKPYSYVNQQNHGIKLEGANGGAPFENTIHGNTVTGNGNAGIFIPSTCPDFGPDAACQGPAVRDNVVMGNQVNRNGFGYPSGVQAVSVFEGPANGGSGIVLMIGGPNPPIRQTVTGNTVNENAKNGIAVLPHRPGNPSTMSTFIGNTALRNNVLTGGGSAYNAMDGNAVVNPSVPCDSNVWRSNNFGQTAADINGPVPANNLTNNPCVGPVLP